MGANHGPSYKLFFRSKNGVNRTLLEALMVMDGPVFGLRPLRAETLKVPKPINWTPGFVLFPAIGDDFEKSGGSVSRAGTGPVLAIYLPPGHFQWVELPAGQPGHQCPPVAPACPESAPWMEKDGGSLFRNRPWHVEFPETVPWQRNVTHSR